MAEVTRPRRVDRRWVLATLSRTALAVAVLEPACTSRDDGADPSGFVSAYVLVRGGEAAVVDTGVEGSADAIEAALSAAGVGWDAVGHVVLTHRHPDHVGSVGAVLEAAPDATVHAGADDVPADRIAALVAG